MQPLIAANSAGTSIAIKMRIGNLDILSVSCKKGSIPILTVNSLSGSAEHVQVWEPG
jgi:hypothetical protein